MHLTLFDSSKSDRPETDKAWVLTMLRWEVDIHVDADTILSIHLITLWVGY